MSASQSSAAPSIDQNRLPEIHQVACRAVTQIVHGQAFDPVAALGDLADAPISGIFVTLKRGATLRGCCGMQGPSMPLGQALLESATRTAKHDPRMTPITAIELPYLDVSVSILGPSRILAGEGEARAENVEIGRHGLRIRQGKRSGLLLPAVARERHWNARQFLDAVCVKAGLPPESWRRADAEVQIFDGIDYSGPMREAPKVTSDLSPFGEVELERLRGWIQANIVAFQSGAAPSYYATGAPDGEVAGVIVRVFPDPSQPPAFAELTLSTREPIPLQRTLLNLSSAAARSTTDAKYVDGWRADLTILSSLIHHGTAAGYDIREVTPAHRALIAVAGNRWSAAYAPEQPVEETMQRVLAAESFHREQTSIFSACCDSTESAFRLSKGPRARQPANVRPPAVAGTFYPQADSSRDAMVDQFLSALPAVEPQTVAAAMVPHAGLKYSGRIATDVWRRIKLPDTVLIIGPKHTRHGVDWAVAGHTHWQLSETTAMANDVELANRIAETVPGMEIDVAAHAQEHGIEVQLPILYRLAPQTKVAAIAMAGGNFAELEQASRALARILQSFEQPPLLIISSDMNHFADDDENRRRDRLALDRLQNDDPQGLLEICAAENISMCGQIPAALVLLILRAMGKTPCYREIAYDTSASVSGDRSRVVGYAGVLF